MEGNGSCKLILVTRITDIMLRDTDCNAEYFLCSDCAIVLIHFGLPFFF